MNETHLTGCQPPVTLFLFMKAGKERGINSGEPDPVVFDGHLGVLLNKGLVLENNIQGVQGPNGIRNQLTLDEFRDLFLGNLHCFVPFHDNTLPKQWVDVNRMTKELSYKITAKQ